MSEADSPSLDRDPFESTPADSAPVGLLPVEILAASETCPSTEWHTVDFPGAISVDAIPQATEAAEVELEKTELDRAQQENADLLAHLTQLEQDFTQAQIEWQLETARLLNQVSESTPPEQAEAVQTQLITAQEQLSRLFQELELSHQAAQRQQILVETLTEQLESSQERIAELERDCATAQQRYNEQVQQRLQAESDCRDLRIRLNRQQQHTLQFKVALEKCLEMPSPVGRAVASNSLLPTEADPLLNEAIASPQNSPVQPWSAPTTQPAKPFFPHLPNSLGTVFRRDESPASADPLELLVPAGGSSQQNPTDLMNLIFPSQSPESAIVEQSSSAEQPPNTIFDVSPLLAEADEPMNPTSTQLQQVSNGLWQDSTHLPESQATAEKLETDQLPDCLGSSQNLSDSCTEAAEVSDPFKPLQIPKPISPKPISGEGLTDSATSSLPLSHSPSPIVYPLRPAKKRQSLAAVELPTFPRSSKAGS